MNKAYRVTDREGNRFDVMTQGPVLAVREAIRKKGAFHKVFKVNTCKASEAEFEVIEIQMGRAVGKVYCQAKLNVEEERYMDTSALHQNWLASMELVYEWPERQIFFDSKTRCFYDCTDTGNGINILEISPSNNLYGPYACMGCDK